ncbi:hypothetical protein B0H11DRAFT_2247063 [Mycena galericulata]|nr:hypothetical protein B0H11DRAFT_2247063 [Mycena galericulata]
MNREFLDGATDMTDSLLQELNLRLEVLLQSTTEKGVAEIAKGLIKELVLFPAQLVAIAKTMQLDQARLEEREAEAKKWVEETTIDLLETRVALDERTEENDAHNGAIFPILNVLFESTYWVQELAAARACIAEREQNHVREQRKTGTENKEKLCRARAELVRMRAKAVEGTGSSTRYISSSYLIANAADILCFIDMKTRRQLRIARFTIARTHAVRVSFPPFRSFPPFVRSFVPFPSTLPFPRTLPFPSPRCQCIAAKLGARYKLALGLQVGEARRSLSAEQAEHEALQATCRDLCAQIERNVQSAAAAQGEFEAVITKLKHKYEKAKAGRRAVKDKLAELEGAKENFTVGGELQQGGDGVGNGKRKRGCDDAEAEVEAQGDGGVNGGGKRRK